MEANHIKRKRLINLEKMEADLLELDNKLEELGCKQASIIGKATAKQTSMDKIGIKPKQLEEQREASPGALEAPSG